MAHSSFSLMYIRWLGSSHGGNLVDGEYGNFCLSEEAGFQVVGE